MWLVDQVSVQQRRPLLRWNPQAGLHGNVDDLSVVFSPQSLVRPKLFLQLHQRGVLITLGHLVGRTDDGVRENKKETGEWEERRGREGAYVYFGRLLSSIQNKSNNNQSIQSLQLKMRHLKCRKQLIILHFGISAGMKSDFFSSSTQEMTLQV